MMDIFFMKILHKPQKYPQVSNYRCSNYRKDERILKNQFCNALLKRKCDA